MDSDSAIASVESIQDDSESIRVSNEPNTCGNSSVGEEGSEGVTGMNSSVEGIDAVNTAVASEVVPPEQFSTVGEGEVAILKSFAEVGDVVKGQPPVDVASAELSPVAIEVGGGGEENAAFVAQGRDSMDSVGGGAEVEVAPVETSTVVGEREEKGDAAADPSDSPPVGGHVDSISGDGLEEKKELSMEEEPTLQQKREESEQKVVADESELGQKSESEIEKLHVMEDETTAQDASIEDIVNDIEIPDDKEVASVAGFTEISSKDKELDDSVLNSGSEFVEEEPLKELEIGEGAKDLTYGDSKYDVDVKEDSMDIQVLKKTEEEAKVNAASELEMETKPGEVDDVVTEVTDKNETPVDRSSDVGTQFAGETRNDNETVMDDVKDDVEEDPEAGKSGDIHVPEVAEVVETDCRYGAEMQKEGDGMGGMGEAGQSVDLEGTRELSEELAKVEERKIAEVSEEKETMIRTEDQENDDDMTDVAENVETHLDSSVADIRDGMEDNKDLEKIETQEETVVSKGEGTKNAEVSEETMTRIEDEDEKKDDDMTDGAENVETHEDSSVADIGDEMEDNEEMEKTETLEEAVMGKGEETKNAEVSEETETKIEDEDEEKDDDMTDGEEDVETHGDSSVADIEEERENGEEMVTKEMTVTQEESVMAETGDEEPEEVEEENKSIGVKRKRGRNTTKTVKGTGKKKEEDVCFMCFDGGDLVLCDRRGCPKAYHPSCVDRDEAFFRSKGKWNCGWHLCSKCEKTATYLCYTCMFSLCKGCAKDAVFFCIRGNKGLCETCMETVKLIERKEQEEKEPAQLDFDDKSSWEYLFKDYWTDLKTQLSLSPEELDQAKSPVKGNESRASKQGTASETDYVTDGGSDSDSSPKKRKTRSRSKSDSTENFSGETTEWASKELLDLVVHMRRGDRSYLPELEVHKLLLGYIKRYNLRDPRGKSQVICDSRLQNLFKKSHVGHFEMLNLLESHFLKKEQHQADDLQGSIVDENLDHPMKSVKDKKRKTRKKGARKGRQSNLDDFAGIDMHNINLIYLRRSLVEDLLEDSTAFEEKVASAFVRLRIVGNQKQDLYRLVQVVGTSKAPEPYKVGKKTTDFVLEILNLDKTEVISIDIISNQDFTEDECKRLKQSIKCGLINRLTVGDIQEKAIALQEVRVKNLLEAEILRFSHLRDRASDMGHRKELRECVEKLQLLKSPEERQRRLEEIPEIHADPKMDPDCESEDEDEKEEKEKEKRLRPRSSSFNRRGREAISPRKGGFSSNEAWTSTSNFSNTSATRGLSRSYSDRGSSGRGEYRGSSDDRVSESMWTSSRERETQQTLVSEKPRPVSLPDTPARSSRAVVPPELSPRIASEVSTTPPAVVPQPVPKSNDSEKMWHYKDPSGKVQGPFSMAQLRKWNNTGYFPAKLEIWKAMESPLDSILLTDALAGLFQKQTLSVDNSFTKAQVAAYPGQSSQSEPGLGSSARTAPTIEIPRNSQDAWNSGGGLPSPTPNQITTPTAKRRNFESRWSPTKPSAALAVPSMNYSLPQSGPSQATRVDVPVVGNSAGALQPQTHPIPTPDLNNFSVNHSATLPSPTPAGGKQSWGSMQTDKFESHGYRGSDAPSQNSSTSYGTATPNVLPSQNQPSFAQSESWRVPVPSQPNAQSQAPANNLQWGNVVNINQNSGQPQAPANQNSSWSQGTVNPNMGWVGPAQAGNWTGSSVPPTGQAIPNSGWGGTVQGQPQAYQNPGWPVAAFPQVQAQAQVQAQTQVQSQALVQGPGSSTGSGWMQPGQGIQSGNSNQNWASHSQTAIPSGGSGGNQAGFWGNQSNQDGDSGYGWNRQSSGSGGQNNFSGQRVCKFYRENRYCKKGAACNYLHS